MPNSYWLRPPDSVPSDGDDYWPDGFPGEEKSEELRTDPYAWTQVFHDEHGKAFTVRYTPEQIEAKVKSGVVFSPYFPVLVCT